MATPAMKVFQLVAKHKSTWRDKSQYYWFWRLVLEVIELALALLGKHRHSPDYELQQIASICINWLDMRGV